MLDLNERQRENAGVLVVLAVVALALLPWIAR